MSLSLACCYLVTFQEQFLLQHVHNVLQQVDKEVPQILAVDEGGAVVHKGTGQHLEVAIHCSALGWGQPPLEFCMGEGQGRGRGGGEVSCTQRVVHA